jgi:aerobic carbon-monoxide dehydrogenase medium subunit
MMPAAFEYVRAKSVSDALTLLGKHKGAKLIAGGHSLLPMMKLRFAQPAMLVDIGRLADLAETRHDAGRFHIGALTTHAALAVSSELERFAPALWNAANQVGDAQVRNRGTIGGSVAHADPTGDYPAVMLALDARFVVEGKGGRREVKADEFFVGTFETKLGHDDVLTHISFADAPTSAYVKLRHPASHFAIVGVAANVTLKDGAIAGARIGVTGVSDRAFRAPQTEKALAGVKAHDVAAVRKACTGIAAASDVHADVAASAAYRAAMVDVYAARAVEAALLPAKM